ncbi:MAG: tyrosine-type recombinase/integrase [Eubacteriales bacterium]
MTTYSSGLRISETLNLRVSDIDSKNMMIRVNQDKDNKDRWTVLSIENLKMLRLYWNFIDLQTCFFLDLLKVNPSPPETFNISFKSQ